MPNPRYAFYDANTGEWSRVATLDEGIKLLVKARLDSSYESYLLWVNKRVKITLAEF